jgi:hypothetical protein
MKTLCKRPSTMPPQPAMGPTPRPSFASNTLCTLQRFKFLLSILVSQILVRFANRARPWRSHVHFFLSGGSPLTLDEILGRSLFRRDALSPNLEKSSFALTVPGASFPLISQGDHPILGMPCWYLHPCETPAAVAEIMAELDMDTWPEEERLVRWMEVWFMVLGSTIDLFPRLS